MLFQCVDFPEREMPLVSISLGFPFMIDKPIIKIALAIIVVLLD